MTTKTLIPGLAGVTCALLLSACAADDPVARTLPPPPSLEALSTEAQRAAGAGHADQALAIWKNAATAYPADKGPWLAMAQLKYERSQYADAIAHAQEALRRDPLDAQAGRLLAASGLRLSVAAYADLQAQNSLQGAVRSEAQELARQLRGSVGDDAAPAAAPVKKPAPVKRAAPAKPAAAQAGSSDPFGTLK
jgi:tetratricopeptide (TPR) repeat protein